MKVNHLYELVAVSLKCMILTIEKLYQKCQHVHTVVLRGLNDTLESVLELLLLTLQSLIGLPGMKSRKTNDWPISGSLNRKKTLQVVRQAMMCHAR